ncbi:hypothetical protein [Nocardia jejuensis]|uniref:hypothetical protein n=1 Tax=Nocardia jejuensis TaxID=328049 RepID=UPI00082DDAF1|nr:hypothetical protein [Nocardia jejuensis]
MSTHDTSAKNIGTDDAIIGTDEENSRGVRAPGTHPETSQFDRADADRTWAEDPEADSALDPDRRDPEGLDSARLNSEQSDPERLTHGESARDDIEAGGVGHTGTERLDTERLDGESSTEFSNDSNSAPGYDSPQSTRYDSLSGVDSAPSPGTGSVPAAGDDGSRLLAEADQRRLREEWREVQTQFVDDPKDAVSRADTLVDDAIRQLTDSCAQRRQQLESGWSQGQDVDTEALRQALRGYRDLFDQLVGTASVAKNI